MTRIPKRFIVGHGRWKQILDLVPRDIDDDEDRAVLPRRFALQGLPVQLLPDLLPEDAFVEYLDGAVERVTGGGAIQSYLEEALRERDEWKKRALLAERTPS